jgi:hypothetical protein
MLNSSYVTERGLIGDRTYTIVDKKTGKVASAKNPVKWGKLFDFRSVFIDQPQVVENIPPGHQQVAGTPTTLPVNNGQTVFTLSVSASANCPPPQAGSVTFTNVGVSVEGTVLPIPGTF